MLCPLIVRLNVNQICVYNFCNSAADVIHTNNPLHLIIYFELFRHTLTLCYLLYEPKKHILGSVLSRLSFK